MGTLLCRFVAEKFCLWSQPLVAQIVHRQANCRSLNMSVDHEQEYFAASPPKEATTRIADVAGKEQDCHPFPGREANSDVLKSWIGSKKSPYQGVAKRDWVPTGRIDFATNLHGNDNPDQLSEFRLLVEERRIVESIAGNENLEIQWRLATLREAKAFVTQYHKYLATRSSNLYSSPSYCLHGLKTKGHRTLALSNRTNASRKSHVATFSASVILGGISKDCSRGNNGHRCEQRTDGRYTPGAY
ncbi:MAG TPA: hypothetical protein VFF31_07000 [Blastocatellia bacterium]|nr:hypothetical protein [Blastocatellia bacterium]